MIAIDFPESNLKLAENQPEYETLPVLLEMNKEGVPVTCCFQLSDEEIKEIVTTGKIWHTQLTFGNHFQPISMTTIKPF